jgi:hypothetical protein
MRNLFSIIVCLGILTLVSCQREVDDTPTDPSSTDHPLLSKFVEVDTVFTTPTDTQYSIQFKYDAQKRVTESVTKSYFNYPLIDIETEKYFYNGTDTLPFKAIAYYTDAVNNYIDTVFLFYSNGLIRKDSTISTNTTTGTFFGIDVKEFTAAGNNTLLAKRSYYTRNTSVPDDTYNTTYLKTYNNGNIAIQEDADQDAWSTQYGFYELTFDNHPNPFYRVKLPYPIIVDALVQKNNLLSHKQWSYSPPLDQDHHTYSYVYKANGYPELVRITEVGNFVTGWKGFYYYE